MTEDTLDMRDEDRLPWLEAVEEDEDEGIGLGKMIGGVLVALAVIALVISGIFWLRNNNSDAGSGEELIAAPEEDYRVRPSEAGGMEVAGTGDVQEDVSGGGNPTGTIDANAGSETPVNGTRASSDDSRATTGGSSATIPANNRQLAEDAPRRPSTASASSGNVPSASSGRLIQLGAYSSQAAANAAWTQISGSNSALGSLTKAVTQTQSGGRTLYRLRAVAASRDAARSTCSALTSAGQACSVVVN